MNGGFSNPQATEIKVLRNQQAPDSPRFSPTFGPITILVTLFAYRAVSEIVTPQDPPGLTAPPLPWGSSGSPRGLSSSLSTFFACVLDGSSRKAVSASARAAASSPRFA